MINFTSNVNNYSVLFDKEQHKILGRVERDKATLRLSALVAVQIPDGRKSDDVVIQRSRLLERGWEKELKWIKDYSEVFGENELKIIRKEVFKLLEKPKDVSEIADKATKEEVYEILVRDIKYKGSELVSPDGIMIMIPTVLLKGNKGYVRTREFEHFVTENKSLGWSRLDILKMLKRNDLLEIGEGRTYDKKVKINGISNNFYVIKIHEADDEPDETIEIEKGGNKC